MDAHSGRIDRRVAVKWMLTAVAGLALARRRAQAGEAAPGPSGYGVDPNLLKDCHPGDLWPLTFTDDQRRAAAALCDVIIPAEDPFPSAASLGVQDFIDEWISAPYEDCAEHRLLIVGGLAWLDAESRRRFGSPFAELTEPQKAAICDDLCDKASAKPIFREAAHFFGRFRDLVVGGYFSTPEGAKDLGYVGNIPSATFEGPPPDLIKRLGLS